MERALIIIGLLIAGFAVIGFSVTAGAGVLILLRTIFTVLLIGT